jgi:DnaJ-domain-containing protein 1
MELRQEAEDASIDDEVLRLREENSHRRAAVVRQLEAAFKAKDWAAARSLVHQLTYWHKVEEVLQEKVVNAN